MNVGRSRNPYTEGIDYYAAVVVSFLSGDWICGCHCTTFAVLGNWALATTQPN